MTREERCRRFVQTDLYPVITEAFCAGRDSLEVLAAALKGGARIVQLREKELRDAPLLERAHQARRLTQEAGALLIINDRVDVALAVGADGVHLGQEDLPLTQARRLAPDLLLGISTHSEDEAREAEAGGADYINIGPVFATSTKHGVIPPLGLERMASIASRVRIPFSVMGGIHEHNLTAVLNHGARRVAMVTEVTQTADVTARVRRLREILQEHAVRRPAPEFLRPA